MKMEIGSLLFMLLFLSPILGLILWWWNEIRYVGPIKAKYSNFKLPPGHLGFPFIGEMHCFSWYFNVLRRPDDFINCKIAKYGHNVGAYRTYLFGSPSIIVCSSSMCKTIIQSSNGDFIPAWPKSIVGANSVLAIHGTRHQTIKSFIVNYINRPESLSRIVLHIQPNLINALESWSQTTKIKAFVELKKVILDYMRRYMVCCELGISIDDLTKLYTDINRGIRAQPWNFPGTATHHAIQCRKKLIKLLRDELEKRKKEKLTTNETMSSTNDLMDGLMQMKDKEGKSLSDEEVLDNVFLLIQLSHTTTGYSMPWSLYFLAKSPHVLQKLREENMCMSQKKNGEYLTYEDVLELKYTLKVVEEIIRMTSISGFLLRKATQNVEYKGYMIPKNWQVIMWIRYLHTDPQNFDDPLCFNPDRWDKRPKNGTFLPFGGGPKTCAGYMVARLNIAIFIHYLSIGYKWELINPDIPIKYLSYPHPADGLEISMSKIWSP